MKISALIAAVLLAGCNRTEVLWPADYERAVNACAPNGGLKLVVVAAYEADVVAYCNNTGKFFFKQSHQ